MSEFIVFNIEKIVRSKCELHKIFFKKFRDLQIAIQQEHHVFKVVDNRIIRIVTNDLTDSYMENEIEGKISWSDNLVLTNNDQDKIAINHLRDKSDSGKSNQLVAMWLKNRQRIQIR